jgi:CheY-like chemotaxis protein
MDTLSIADSHETVLSAPAEVQRGHPQDQPPLRVVVVDDHELLRAGTRRILDEASGFSVVGEAEDGEAALRVVAEVEPDVVLVDIRLPSMNGIDLARQIVTDRPDVTVLILSAYDDENYVRSDAGRGRPPGAMHRARLRWDGGRPRMCRHRPDGSTGSVPRSAWS